MEAAKVWAAWDAAPVQAVVEQVARELRLGVWIVGGAVRDALLGLPVQDWDLATTQAVPLAETLATRLHCRPVLLHADLPTYRLTARGADGEDTQLDVVQLRAPTLTADLLARDLSLNALAAGVLTRELLDPAGGLADLRAGRLRALGLPNLQADPLRCLRVYRFYSQFGFSLTPTTRAWVGAVAPEIARVAGERVGEELLRMLQPPRAAQALRLMDEDSLLGVIVPELEATRGVEQGHYHHLEVWGHTLDVVARLEEILGEPGVYFPRSEGLIREYLQAPDRTPVLLLAALLHDLAKPLCRRQDEQGRWRFFDHDVEGAVLAGRIARRLALRREHTALLGNLIRNHLRPLQLANLQVSPPKQSSAAITLSALRRLFRDTHPDGLGLLLLALADARGCRGPATTPDYHARLAQVLDDMMVRFGEYRAQRARPPLLTGQDLIAAGFAPGPRFGAVLAQLEEALAEGKIEGRAEALALAVRLLTGEGQTEAEGE